MEDLCHEGEIDKEMDRGQNPEPKDQEMCENTCEIEPTQIYVQDVSAVGLRYIGFDKMYESPRTEGCEFCIDRSGFHLDHVIHRCTYSLRTEHHTNINNLHDHQCISRKLFSQRNPFPIIHIHNFIVRIEFSKFNINHR